MYPLLIEQLGCYLADRMEANFLDREPPSKDEFATMIAEFMDLINEPLRDSLGDKLSEYEEVEHGDDWNPYDASGGNFNDAYQMGVRDGEARLAAELRDLLGIE